MSERSFLSFAVISETELSARTETANQLHCHSHLLSHSNRGLFCCVLKNTEPSALLALIGMKPTDCVLYTCTYYNRGLTFRVRCKCCPHKYSAHIQQEHRKVRHKTTKALERKDKTNAGDSRCPLQIHLIRFELSIFTKFQNDN